MDTNTKIKRKNGSKEKVLLYVANVLFDTQTITELSKEIVNRIDAEYEKYEIRDKNFTYNDFLELLIDTEAKNTYCKNNYEIKSEMHLLNIFLKSARELYSENYKKDWLELDYDALLKKLSKEKITPNRKQQKFGIIKCHNLKCKDLQAFKKKLKQDYGFPLRYEWVLESFIKQFMSNELELKVDKAGIHIVENMKSQKNNY